MAGIPDRRQPEDADAARRFGERQHYGVRIVSGRFALGPEVKRGAAAGGAMLYDASRAGNSTAMPRGAAPPTSSRPTAIASCCATTAVVDLWRGSPRIVTGGATLR